MRGRHDSNSAHACGATEINGVSVRRDTFGWFVKGCKHIGGKLNFSGGHRFESAQDAYQDSLAAA